MKWKKFTLTTTTEAVDLVSSMLDDVGIEGIEVEDNVPLTEKETKGMFIDILPELPPDEGVAKVSFYLDDDDQVEEMLRRVNEGLDELAAYTELGQRTIEASETEDKDWINNWKQYFKPERIGKYTVVKPTWEKYTPKDGELIIEIDPGMAFGTGNHATTALCINVLEDYVKPGMDIIDVGTGSGILAVQAALLGAEKVLAMDFDPVAVKAATENVALNHLENKISVKHSDLLKAADIKGDIIIANIVADIIIRLLPDVPNYLKGDRIFISSGIIDTRRDDVLAVYEQVGIEVLEVREDKGWVAIVGKYRERG